MSGSLVESLPSQGTVLECTETLILYSVSRDTPTVYAHPGDLCIIIHVHYDHYSYHDQATIMFFDGGSMVISDASYRKHFRILKNFPRTLNKIRKYGRNWFGMRRKQ